MRTTAAAVGVTGTTGAASRMGASPVGSARAIAPALIVGGGFAAGVAVDYLIRNDINPFTGDTNEEYTELNADAVQTRIYQNALSMKQANTAVYGSISNLLSSSANFVISEAKKTAVDEMNAGSDISTVKSEVESVINEFYATQQKNLLAHQNAQKEKVLSWRDVVNNTSGLSIPTVFKMTKQGDGNRADSIDRNESDVELVNGETAKVVSTWFNESNTGLTVQIDITITYDWSVTDTEGTNTRISGPEKGIWDNVISENDDVVSNMKTWVDEVYPKYNSGDIDSSDIISANDLINDSQTQDGYSFAGASLASMGLKTSDFALEIELVETGEVVEGAIYHNDDSVTSLQRDVQYDPETDISGTVYLAYNVTSDGGGGGTTNTTNTTSTGPQPVETGGELVELTEPFIIRSITDGEGNSYNAANYESKNQQTFDTDISKIEEELQQVREIREDLEEQRDAAAMDDGGGAGAGWFEGDSPDVGVIAAVVGGAGVVYALFGQGDN